VSRSWKLVATKVCRTRPVRLKLPSGSDWCSTDWLNSLTTTFKGVRQIPWSAWKISARVFTHLPVKLGHIPPRVSRTDSFGLHNRVGNLVKTFGKHVRCLDLDADCLHLVQSLLCRIPHLDELSLYVSATNQDLEAWLHKDAKLGLHKLKRLTVKNLLDEVNYHLTALILRSAKELEYINVHITSFHFSRVSSAEEAYPGAITSLISSIPQISITTSADAATFQSFLDKELKLSELILSGFPERYRKESLRPLEKFLTFNFRCLKKLEIPIGGIGKYEISRPTNPLVVPPLTNLKYLSLEIRKWDLDFPHLESFVSNQFPTLDTVYISFYVGQTKGNEAMNVFDSAHFDSVRNLSFLIWCRKEYNPFLLVKWGRIFPGE